MKKKAQGTKIVIVLLIIIAVALIVIVIRQFNPSTSGNVINEDAFAQESCVLGEPFVCLDNSIATSKGVLFFISNSGNEDIFMQKMTLTNCLEVADLTNNGKIPGILINSGSTTTLTLLCDNELEKLFRGNIEITYEVVGSSTKSKATGSIVRTVL
jgi:hypothetical protein